MKRKKRNTRTSSAKWLLAFLTAVAWVSLAEEPPLSLTGIEVQNSPDAAVVTVHGTGEPGAAYQLDWTPVLANDAVWTHAGDAVAGDDGSFSMRATPLQQPGFYRVAAESCDFGIYSVTQSGNAILNVYGNAFAALGFEYGDVLRASVGGQDYRMPVVSAYAEVDSGDMLCRVVLAEDEGQSAVVLAINGGNFAQTAGLGTNKTIQVVMDEKGGYLDEYILRHLGGTTNRADYADLTDEQYANFRPVAAPGIAAGALYRSSSPVNPVLNRNREADTALDGAGVRSVLNLADTEDAMKAYPGFAETHYAERTILPLAMTMDYMSGEFRDKLATALRFIAGSDGPWLVHCSHGKDRTSFLCAVLECLAGADADAVVADYMESYVNLYHLVPGTEQYETIAEGNIVKELQETFGLPDLRAEGVDLAEAARQYLLGIGLGGDEIAALLEKISAGGW